MPAPEPTAASARTTSVRKLVFFLLQVFVAAEGIAFAAIGVVQFTLAATGDPTPLLVSTLLLLLAAALLYSAVALRSRGSTPFFTTLVGCLFGTLILLSVAAPPALHAIAVVVLLLLVALRNRFQLRPGQFVKEEKLPQDVVAKVSTKVRGVRCKECGDDDVWITSDKLLVCKNCGSVAA